MSTEAELPKSNPELLLLLDDIIGCPCCGAKPEKFVKYWQRNVDNEEGFLEYKHYSCGCWLSLDERSNNFQAIRQCPHATIILIKQCIQTKRVIVVRSRTELAVLTAGGRMGHFKLGSQNYAIDYDMKKDSFWMIDEGTEYNEHYTELPKWLTEAIHAGLPITVDRKPVNFK